MRRDDRRSAHRGVARAAVVRPAGVGDAAKIHALLVEVAAQSPLALLTDLPGDPRALEAGLAASGGDRLLVAVAATDDDQVDGVLFAIRGPGPSAHTANLSLAVAARARRRGMASALIAGAQKWARAHGVERLTASVAAANGPALALFPACGFAIEGRRPDHIRVGQALYDEILFGVATQGVRGGIGAVRVVLP